MKKISWKELDNFLSENHDREGVIVFKNGPYWKQEYPLESRSYRVSGNDNHFHSGKISNSIYGFCLDGSEDCRLDWVIYALPEERWDIDYCYILPKK